MNTMKTGTTLHKTYVATVTEGLAAKGFYEMTVSTGTVDRDGDRVRPEGMDAASFKTNPVLLWSHSRDQLPIGTVTGLTVTGQGVRARFTFLDGDEFAARVKNAFDQGAVRAASIGFRPKVWDRTETGYDITSWELIEVSLCPVPANAEAVRTLKSLGVIPADGRSPLASVRGSDVVLRLKDEPRRRVRDETVIRIIDDPSARTVKRAETTYRVDPAELERAVRAAARQVVKAKVGELLGHKAKGRPVTLDPEVFGRAAREALAGVVTAAIAHVRGRLN